MSKSQIIVFASITFFLFFLSNCSNDSSPKEELTAAEEQMLKEGFQLLESNCFTCHSPDAGMENRIAPPMYGIKKHYIEDGTTKKEFTDALVSFVQEPKEEKSKMPRALERFGLMPKMNFSEEQLISMATYIYHSELEKPGWFDKHYKTERKKYLSENSDAELSFEAWGLKKAMGTKAVLGKNLLTAINQKGTTAAVEFCNTKAFPLTDSMAMVLDADIKRVSDQPRNPANIANESELEYISESKEALKNGEKLKPRILKIDGKEIGYYPILTNQMCMQCHGQPETEIKTATIEKLNQLYPKDKAKGYGLNELRGIWVVEKK